MAAILTVLALAATGIVRSAAPPAANGVPWVEGWTPEAFDAEGRPVLAEWGATYRVDATVLLPLLFASIPVDSREGVGVAGFLARDYAEEGGAWLRTYEFFATSYPERARGLNRVGLVREAVRLTPNGAEWTAHFGVISANLEETKDAAQRALNTDADVQPYSVIEELIGADAARGSAWHLLLPGRWTGAAELYADVRPRWLGREPDYTRELPNRDRSAYAEPLGFLGSLQVGLRSVAAAVARGVDPRTRPRYQPYVHNGRVFRFELRDIDEDEDRARLYAQAGWVADPTALRRLKYRIRDAKNDTVETFTLWVELPAHPDSGPFATPIVPVAFEFTPRAFLALKAVRVTSPAPALRAADRLHTSSTPLRISGSSASTSTTDATSPRRRTHSTTTGSWVHA